MSDLGPNVVRFRIPSASIRYKEVRSFTPKGGDYEIVLARMEGDDVHVHLLLIGDHMVEPIRSFIDAPAMTPLIELIADCCDTAAFAALQIGE